MNGAPGKAAELGRLPLGSCLGGEGQYSQSLTGPAPDIAGAQDSQHGGSHPELVTEVSTRSLADQRLELPDRHEQRNEKVWSISIFKHLL